MRVRTMKFMRVREKKRKSRILMIERRREMKNLVWKKKIR